MTLRAGYVCVCTTVLIRERATSCVQYGAVSSMYGVVWSYLYARGRPHRAFQDVKGKKGFFAQNTVSEDITFPSLAN